MDRVAVFVFALAGLSLTTWGVNEWQSGRATHGWPQTRGVIEESRGTDAQKPTLDYLHLSYAYTVGSKRFVGHRVQLGHNGKSGTALARMYPVGREVDVRFDPRDPSSAVLVPGSDPVSPALKGIMGVLLQVLALRAIRRRAHALRSAAAQAAASP